MINRSSSDLILVGATGRLGNSILKNNEVTFGISSKKNHLVGEKIDHLLNPLLGSLKDVSIKELKTPILIDASFPENFESIYDFCFHNKVPLVLASTGHNDTQINKLKELSKIIPILHAPNLSRGIAFFKAKILNPLIDDFEKYLSKVSSKIDGSIKIIETHHNKKKDSPSGTAIELRNYILNRISHETDIQIKSVRDESSIGKHEVIFNFGKEEILVSHNALSRDIFGEGARLSIFLKSKNPSIYSMEDFLEEEN